MDTPHARACFLRPGGLILNYRFMMFIYAFAFRLMLMTQFCQIKYIAYAVITRGRTSRLSAVRQLYGNHVLCCHKLPTCSVLKIIYVLVFVAHYFGKVRSVLSVSIFIFYCTCTEKTSKFHVDCEDLGFVYQGDMS